MNIHSTPFLLNIAKDQTGFLFAFIKILCYLFNKYCDNIL